MGYQKATIFGLGGRGKHYSLPEEILLKKGSEGGGLEGPMGCTMGEMLRDNESWGKARGGEGRKKKRLGHRGGKVVAIRGTQPNWGMGNSREQKTRQRRGALSRKA